jgi:hypothetical protein
MSIQTHPSQSIVKTVQTPLASYSSSISGAISPTLRYNYRKTVLTLRRMAWKGGWGRFAMIPSHLPNREVAITDHRVLPASPSV